jgi:hypothetical protein
MPHYVSLFLMALVGLLLLIACQPTATPAMTPAATPTSVPPGEPSPAPTVTSTVQASPLATPTPTATTETSSLPTPAAPTATPTTQLSPLATPTQTATTGTSPLPPPVPPTAQAGNADVTHVRAVQDADGTWTFHVTVQHPDIGWEDYADGWDVVTPDGTVVKPDPDSPFTRLLLHPHVDEQPFTRSQSQVAIPPDVTQVRVRAHDLVDGFGGREVVVDLTVSSGPDFEVERP